MQIQFSDSEATEFLKLLGLEGRKEVTAKAIIEVLNVKKNLSLSLSNHSGGNEPTRPDDTPIVQNAELLAKQSSGELPSI